MDEQITAVVDPETMRFCEDGMKPGRKRVPLPRSPDAAREKWSGDDAAPFTALSAVEIKGQKNLRHALLADEMRRDNPAYDALLYTLFWVVNNREPSSTDFTQLKIQFRAALAAVPGVS